MGRVLNARLISRCMISACLAGFPAVLAAETPAQAATPPAVQTEAQPPAASLLSRLAVRYPVYATVEGQPIDPRPPEKSDDKPLSRNRREPPTTPARPSTLRR
jgi:hypothetical protein